MTTLSKPARVTVIVPNYNHARFLRRRLQSIFDQTFQDWELVLLDDASTDNSREVLSEFAGDSRVRTAFNAVNSGNVFKQWNKGVRMARTPYVWLAESDDAADPRLLASLVGVLDAHPNVGLAYCQSMRIDEQGAVTESLAQWTADLDPEHWTQDFINSGLDECQRYLARRGTIPNASAVVFRREVYDRIGGADESFQLCGDFVTWVRMLIVSDVAFVAAPMNYYRSHAATQRNALLNTVRLLAEQYRVLQFVVREVHPEPAIVQTHLDQYYYMFRQHGIPARKTDPARYRALCRLARRVDPAWHRRRFQSIMEGTRWGRCLLWYWERASTMMARVKRRTR